MKKPIALLCLILAAALLFPTAAVSALAEPSSVEEAVPVCAVVSLTEGGELIVDEAPDAALMNEADSYDLYVEDEPVLSVEHLSAGVTAPVSAPQYYSAEFSLPDSQTEVFLTGLTAQNVGEIQQKIIDSYVRGENFSVTDLGFIDAEKTYNEDEDDQMCWAASASDMLVYTGWAAQAGFGTEDDLFEAFIGAFDNNGGYQGNAVAWFFNGAALGDNSGGYGARIVNYPDSGKYLNDYAFDRVIREGSFTIENMDRIAAELRSGSAVGINAQVYYNGGYGGGHALTLWGFIADSAVPQGDPARYQAVIVTDSDSDERMDADRRTSPNVMQVYTLGTDEGYYTFEFYSNQAMTVSGKMADYVALSPYSGDLERETDPAAPKDKINYPDLTAGIIYLTDTGAQQEQKTLFESGTALTCSCYLYNNGDQYYAGRIARTVEIRSADGEASFFNKQSTFSIASPGLSPSGYSMLFDVPVPGLEAGDYVMEVRFNTDRSVEGIGEEAFYYNNTSVLPFKVRDSYLLGDYDGDGEVSIYDATMIQRRLAGYSDTCGESALIRSDIDGDGLNIFDVTLVQRYLAGYTVVYPAGEKQLYP